jgi:demethylmenaquinone methyltransferase / 2-methoxy-6-polyprenyl-1,4-benzoquinol methylase
MTDDHFSGHDRFAPPQNKADYVRRHFDQVAQKYDLMNTLLSFGIHYLWKRRAVNLLKAKEGDTVLDVCGGTGDLSVLALKRLKGAGKMVLYDINRIMMERGRHKLSHQSIRRKILYVQGDAEQIAFPCDCFDGAMVGFGIRNLTRMDEGFREMHRVLKPGGRMVCLEFSNPPNPVFRRLYDFYSFQVMPFLGALLTDSREAYTYLPETIRLFPSPENLAGLLKEIGFQEVAYRPLTNGIAFVHWGSKKEKANLLRS